MRSKVAKRISKKTSEQTKLFVFFYTYFLIQNNKD